MPRGPTAVSAAIDLEPCSCKPVGRTAAG
jgi:hypothetical protein